MISPSYRKKIKKWFYHYKNLLAIPKTWGIRINVNEKIKAYAEVSYDYQEKKFNISINPKRNKRTDVLKDSILHELIHILFTPATSRLELLLAKLQCGEKINIQKSKKTMLAYEEWLVNSITKIIINQEKSVH